MGSSYIIPGQLGASRHGPVPVPQTLVDRLLGRRRTASPHVLEWARTKLITFPSHEINGLVRHFRDFLAERLSRPWAATGLVLDGMTPTLYVREEQEPGDVSPRSYVQLAFSGAAGSR